MNQKTENSDSIRNHIGSAIIASLFLIFINLFIMPYNIWVGAIKRLSNLKKSGIISEMRKTELIIFSWLKLLFDSLIVLVYVLAPIIIIVQIIAALSSPFARQSGGTAFGMGLSAIVGIYFSPIFLSLIKEIISIALIQVMKIEKIEENTRKS